MFLLNWLILMFYLSKAFLIFYQIINYIFIIETSLLLMTSEHLKICYNIIGIVLKE